MKPTTRYIPKNARLFTRTEGTDAAVYLYEAMRTDKPCYLAIAYHGKANNHDWHYSYRTAKARAEAVKQFIEARKGHSRLMAERKSEAQKPHSLKVGDVLRNSWGYDQTNIDYYEVTRIVGPHTVEIREIGQDSIEDGFMQGTCVPLSGKFIGGPMIKRANSDNSVKVRDWGSWARKVDKLNVSRWTAYA